MMVRAPRTVVLSNTDSIPFVHGIRHSELLGGGLAVAGSPVSILEALARGETDLALLPAVAYPEIQGLELLTSYCIAYGEGSRRIVLMANNPIDEIRRVLCGRDMPTAVKAASLLAARKWKIRPEWELYDDPAELGLARDGDAVLLTGDDVEAFSDCYGGVYDLADEWREMTDTPLVDSVWVARKGTPYETVDALEHALTAGVEQLWEAIVESGVKEPSEVYMRLAGSVDWLFDEQKHRSLEALWDAGVKVAPKVNPG